MRLSTRSVSTLSFVLLAWLACPRGMAQQLDWYVFSSPTDPAPNVLCLTADPAGNLYTAGWFGANADMDPGPAVVPPPPGTVYISKLDADRTYQWSVAFEELDDYCLPQDMRIDGLGNIIVSGQFGGTVDFDPSPAQVLRTASTGSDCFVCKLGPSGDLLWVDVLGNVTNAWASRIIVDPLNNICVGGLLQHAADFDPGPGDHTLAPVAGTAGYLWKLDPDGNFVWAGLIGGPATSFATVTDVITDANGTLYAAGWHEGAVDLDPGADSHISSMNYGRFVVKLQANGDLDWAAELPDDFGLYLAVDGQNNVIVSGAFLGVTTDPYDFDPGPGSYAVAPTSFFAWKLSPQGDLIWVKVFGDTGWVTEEVWCATDASDNVIISGRGVAGTDLDPGPGSVLAPVDQSYHYISVLNAQGEFVGGGFITDDYNVYDLTRTFAFAPVTDAAGDIYLGGLAWGSIDLDPGPGSTTMVANEVDMDNNQLQSSFVLKLGSLANAMPQADPTDLRIYPVPMRDQLHICMREPLDQVRLVDMCGRTMRTYMPSARVLDVHDLPSGAYVLDVVTRSGHAAQAVIKE